MENLLPYFSLYHKNKQILYSDILDGESGDEEHGDVEHGDEEHEDEERGDEEEIERTDRRKGNQGFAKALAGHQNPDGDAYQDFIKKMYMKKEGRELIEDEDVHFTNGKYIVSQSLRIKVVIGDGTFTLTHISIRRGQR